MVCVRTTETRRQRVAVAATLGGVLAVGVVQRSEDVRLPLILNACGGSWDDGRGWLSAMEEGRERTQTNTSAWWPFSASRSQHINKEAASSKPREIARDRKTIQAVPLGTVHRYTIPGTISECTSPKIRNKYSYPTQPWS